MAISSQAPQECGEGSTTSAWSPERAVKHHERAATKFCSRCQSTKPQSDFARDRFYCRPCISEYLRKYRADNRERVLAQKRQHYALNRERLLAEKREYTRQVSAHVIARRRRQRSSDPKVMAKHNFDRAIRRLAESRATPAWADRAKITEFYLIAQLKTVETGIKHSVDHVYPLQGRHVSGLHVPENLRVITLSENCSKQNKVDDIV